MVSAAGDDSLLPSAVEDFRKTDYWADFFKRRKTPFEWYGELTGALAEVVERYLRPSDKILQIGCGSSRLADELFDHGFRNVSSVDVIESVVLQQRQHAKATSRTTLKFDVADVTDLSAYAPDASFDVVVDKGTLDALLPDESDGSRERIALMFGEVCRVLNPTGGRYMTISLAQSHVLSGWLSELTRLGCFILRVHLVVPKEEDIPEGDERLPVFVLLATKLRMRLPQQMYEFSTGEGAMQRFADARQLLDHVRDRQNYALLLHQWRSRPLDAEVSFYLYPSDSATATSAPRFHVTLIDQESSAAQKPYGVFIVPLGQEGTFMFGTPAGRAQLLAQAGYTRLAVVRLVPGQQFDSLGAVKAELNARVMDYAPRYCWTQGFETPFLTAGTDLAGERHLRSEGVSNVSGRYTVEDVWSTQSSSGLRRLVFTGASNLIQSEARLVRRKRQKKKTQEVVDLTTLCCDHHVALVCGMGDLVTAEDARVCIIGFGGGSLVSFVDLLLNLKAVISAVDIDDCMLGIARDYFAYNPRRSVDLRTLDGVEYVRDLAENGAELDCLVLDVAGGGVLFDDSSSSAAVITAPPQPFLSQQFFADCARVLRSGGLFMMNIVTRDAAVRNDVFSELAHHFARVWHCALPTDVNYVVFATSNDACDIIGHAPKSNLLSCIETLVSSSDERYRFEAIFESIVTFRRKAE